MRGQGPIHEDSDHSSWGRPRGSRRPSIAATSARRGPSARRRPGAGCFPGPAPGRQRVGRHRREEPWGWFPVRLGRGPAVPLYEIHDHDEPPSRPCEGLPGCEVDLELSHATACGLPGLASGVAGRRIPWRVGALLQVLPACLVALAVGFIAVRELVSHRIGVGKGSSLVRSGSEKKDGDASRATALRPKHPPGLQLADDRGARALVAHGRRALVAHGRFPGSASVQKSSIARLAARQSRRATPSAQEPASVAAGSTEEAPLAGARAAEERPRQGPAIAFRATAEAGATASGSAAADPRGGSPVEPSAGASGRPGRDERAASELGFER